MNKIKRDKIAGAVYGFAIGDAMGATTEFMSDKQIKSTFGKVTDIIGGGWLGLKAGEVTDDTQMSICVMNAIVTSVTDSGFREAVGREFIKWYESNPPDVGGQCARGIKRLMGGGKLGYDGDARGNGSLMRALPCALTGNLKWNVIQGDLTHPNRFCRNAIRAYHNDIVGLICGHRSFLPRVEKLMDPTGHVINTLNNALYWANAGSFEDAIIGAVNDGGDADTIAAVAGSLAGAKFGFEAIPKSWLDQLDDAVKSELKKFVFFVFSC